MESINFFELGSSSDIRGQLFFTNFSQLPFTPVRMFFVTTNADLYERGGHGHKKCWQALIPTLSIVSFLTSKDTQQDKLIVNKGSGLIVPPGNWIKFQFKDPNERLIVLASHEYDASDYFY
jgi:hypothetical protein